jgi:hypothetical protein
MSLINWWERARGSIVFSLSLLGAGVFYIGIWAFIGSQFFQLGPWGIAATATLFAVHVALLFFNVQWGISLFVAIFCGALSWHPWTEGGWWGMVLAALSVLMSLVTSFLAMRSFDTTWRDAHLEVSSSPEIVLAEGTPTIDAHLIDKMLEDIRHRKDNAPDILLDAPARGEFRAKAEYEASNTPSEPDRKPVDCTVFAPDRVGREQSGLLQVFLHAPNERQQANADAVKSDREAKERGHKSLVLDAPVGTIFAFVVEIEGFEFLEQKDTLLWTGKPQAATFRFDVPKRSKWGLHTGTVRISIDEMPVGRIDFQIEVVRDARLARIQPAGKEARHYSSCFCSYSNLDREEMLKRLQGMKVSAPDMETFVDVLDLRSGDEWNPRIFEVIDKSDLFVVFWSKNACNSKWVKKESRYALKLSDQRHGRPDFRPIPIEGPPIAPVPRGLKTRHFNDKILGQILAAELEKRAREKEKSDQQRSEA